MKFQALLRAFRLHVANKETRYRAERRGGWHRSTAMVVQQNEDEVYAILVALYDVDTIEGIASVQRFIERTAKVARERVDSSF